MKPVPQFVPAPPIRGGPSAPVQQSNAAAAASQKLTTNDALSYLREVKNRFADRKQVYDTFLDIMKEFKAQRIDTHGVIDRVKKLFKGHRELILGFNTFLPKGYEIELARISDDEEEEEPKQAVEFDQAINYVNKIKTRFAADERVYKAFLEILNQYRKGQKNIQHVYQEVAVLFQHHPDLLNEFTYFLPDNSQQGMQMRQYMRGVYTTSMAGPMAAMRPMPGMGPGGPMMAQAQWGGARGGGPVMVGVPHGGARPYMMPHQMMQPGSPTGDHGRFSHKRKAARRAEEGFRRMDEEDGGGGYGGAAGARGGRGALTKEVQFLEKVRVRLRSQELYSNFLKYLNMYSQELVSRQELLKMVADLLGGMHDLMAQFQQLINTCDPADLYELTSARGAGVGVRGQPPLTNREMLKAKLLKDKFLMKPLSEIVATETQRVTPSYVKMPAEYPKLTQSGRTELGNQVLNDQYVNVITGSEDYSFKLMRKNQYEEALFRCEDDRYEFDIACEQNASTERVLRPIAERLAGMPADEKQRFTWDDVRPSLNAVHLGHISRLYGESGPQLLELLTKNPAVAVPVILTRLQAKEQEWRKVKEEMLPTWKRIYETNYPRSLDHRSFYFKQGEKKLMMTKTMVSEVKESADRRKADEQHLRTLSMAHRHAIPSTASQLGADLSFAYSDRGVFEDVWLAVKTAVEHQLHVHYKEPVLMLYLHTIEPLLGLPERADEIKRIHEQVEDPGNTPMDAMADSSESSEQEGVGNGDKAATPGPEGTPEPHAAGGEDGGAAKPPPDEPRQPPNRQEGSADRSGDEARGAGRAGATYAQCKPVAPWGGTAPSPHHVLLPPGRRLLFGNENIYVFFRYHRYLYERLCAAREFSVEVATKKATAPLRGGGPLGLTPAGDLESRTPQPEVSQAAIKDDAKRIHEQFLQCLQNMLSSPQTPANDVGAYEDQVRSLFGTNSYKLFTLDKLLSRMAKHLQLMITDDATHKLWDMYQYERARGSALSCSMYHINCHTVLDEACYRIEYSDEDNTLRFQLNDLERSDTYLAPEGALPAYITGYINKTVPALLLTQVTAAELGDEESEAERGDGDADGDGGAGGGAAGGARGSRLFLRRSLRGDVADPALRRRLREGGPAALEAADESLAAALQGVVVYNGLETKIACTTYKVSYVLDTEDVMTRRRPAKRRRLGSGGGAAAAAADAPQGGGAAAAGDGDAAAAAARRERVREARVLRFSTWLAAKNEAAEKRRLEEEEAARVLAASVAS